MYDYHKNDFSRPYLSLIIIIIQIWPGIPLLTEFNFMIRLVVYLECCI